KWMESSGLFPESTLDPAERRKRVRIVYKIAVAIIREELKQHELDAQKEERTIFWDPISEVCQRMEVAPSKLSAFCKELTGLTLIHTIDRVRVEMVKGKLRAEIRGFIQERFFTQRREDAETQRKGKVQGSEESEIREVVQGRFFTQRREDAETQRK